MKMKNRALENTAHYPYFLPFPFVFTVMVNILVFFLGLQFTHNKINLLVTYSIYFCYVIAVLWMFWRQRDIFLQRKVLLATAGVALFFMSSFSVSGIRWGVNPYLVRTFFRFLIFVAPAFWFGILTAKKRGEETLLDMLEKYNFVMALFAAVYVTAMSTRYLYPGTSFPNIGIINYMAVSYFTLPFFMTTILQLVRKRKNVTLILKLPIKDSYRILVILLYLVTFLIASTRGAILCLLGGLFLSTIYFLFKDKKAALKAFILFILISGVVSFFTFTYTPYIFRNMARMKSFVENLEQGTLATGVPVSGKDQPIRRELPPSGKYYNIDKNNGQPYVLLEGVKSYLRERRTLYQLANREIQENPIFGLGPLGYYNKYSTYPHNVIYESVVELGIPVAVLWVGFYLFILIRLFVLSRKDISIGIMTLFILTLCIKYLFSSTLWVAPEILFLAGYGLFARKEAKEKTWNSI